MNIYSAKLSGVGTAYWLPERQSGFLFSFTTEKTGDFFNNNRSIIAFGYNARTEASTVPTRDSVEGIIKNQLCWRTGSEASLLCFISNNILAYAAILY
jgi:hypothetical protein